MIIAVSGVDGSGKSTQAHFIASTLQELGYMPTILHLTRWTWVFQIGEKVSQPKSSSPPLKASRPVLWWQKPLRQLFAWIDLLRFWLLVRVRHRGSQVLICDRYFYDLGVQGIYTNHYSERFLKWYWRWSPKPAAAFWLDVPAHLAEKREDGAHASDYYEQKRLLYGRYQPPWPLTVVSVTGLEETQANIKVALLQVLNERP